MITLKDKKSEKPFLTEEEYERERAKIRHKHRVREELMYRLMPVGLLVIIAGVVNLTLVLLDYRRTDSLYADTNDKFVTVSEDVTEEEPQNDTEEIIAAPEREKEWYELVDVDMEGLKATNKEIVGWIFFENEDISYPLLHTTNNSTYLYHTYTGASSNAGSIFIDCESSADLTDPHTIIYGHNMRNLSMFGKLRYYRTEKDYYENHQYFQLITDEAAYRYQIFSYMGVMPDNGLYDVYGKNPKGFAALLKTLKANSLIKSNVDVSEDDLVVTLSTCMGDNGRFVISSKRVDQFIYNDAGHEEDFPAE